MNTMIVTAFFDIGRGEWQGKRKRSKEQYMLYFKNYLGKIQINKFILTSPDLLADIRCIAGQSDIIETSNIDEINSYKYYDRTLSVMTSPDFLSLFNAEDHKNHVEHIHPMYNIITLAKWDALEKAYQATKGTFSHYAWMDFGLGHRDANGGSLPRPMGYFPIARDRIVVSADRRPVLKKNDTSSLLNAVRSFQERCAGGIQIIPEQHMKSYIYKIRQSYEYFLSAGLPTDEQLLIDFVEMNNPDMFFLSHPPSGINKFQHIHSIIHGTDVEAWYQSIPIIRHIGRRHRRKIFDKLRFVAN